MAEYIYKCEYKCMYICMYVRMYEYIHIHTLFFVLLVLWSFSFSHLNADFNTTHAVVSMYTSGVPMCTVSTERVV